MADQRADRRVYLDRVAADLRLPPESTSDVVDELRAHLDDAIAGLEAEGLASALAEREAIARLGDPTTLAVGIRRARQTDRRLLVAAGYGVLAAVRGAFWGYLFAFAIVILAVALSAVAIQVLVTVLDMEGYSWADMSGLLTVPYAVFATGYAGYLVPPVVARHSDRRVADVRWPIAIVGGLVVGLISCFVIRLDMTAMLALALASTPFAFAGGSLLARDDGVERPARIRLDWRTIAIVGTLSAVAISLVAITTLRPLPTDGPGTQGELPTTGPWQYPQAADDVQWSSSSGTTATTSYGMTVTFNDGMPVDWHDLRVEAWPSDDRGIPTPGVEAPVFVVPMTEMTDVPGTYEAF
ncbi:MAG TPA: permease prefix domain 1-containing protein, partial [Candidatus Limnocylindrales bacterium]